MMPMTALRNSDRPDRTCPTARGPAAGAGRPLAGIEDADRRLLERLRCAAMRASCSARLDLFRACACLSADPDRSRAAFADALLRTLGQGLHRGPVFYRPGSPDLSFDERWLLALLRAFRVNDLDSATFLVASRVKKPERRSLSFLARGVAGVLDAA